MTLPVKELHDIIRCRPIIHGHIVDWLIENIVKDHARHPATDGILDHINIVVDIREQNTVNKLAVHETGIQPAFVLPTVYDMNQIIGPQAAS